MVVGRGESDDLRHAELGQHLGVGGLVLGGVVDGADADDHTLARHQARHRVDSADRARVGERHGDAGEVVGADLVGADLAYEVLVGGPEAAEVEGVGVADAGDEERPRPVALVDVDREPEAHVLVVHHAGLAVDLGERRVHRRHPGERLDHGVADEVGERDLAPARAPEVVVEDEAVDLEQLGGHDAGTGGRGHDEAGGHVGSSQAEW